MIKKLLKWALFPPIKPQESGSSWEVTTTATVATPSIVQPAHRDQDDFSEQVRSTRAASHFQQEFLNVLMTEANVNLSNYMPAFFAQLQPGAPGKRLEKMSSLGELYSSLSAGEFVPNEALGEKAIDPEFYNKTLKDLQSQYGVGDHHPRFGNNPKQRSKVTLT